MNITEKAIVVSGLVFLYIGVALTFGSCFNRKHKTVEPDYVSDSISIKLLKGQKVEEIVLDDGSVIVIPDGVTYIEIMPKGTEVSADYDIDFPDNVAYDSDKETVEQYLRRFGIERGLPWIGDGN
jgi:hypothetical protein